MNRLVKGLEFIVSGEELYDHLEKRRIHHQTRKEFYEHQYQSLPTEDKNTPATLDVGKSVMNKVTEHHRKEDLFKFMADHTDHTADYALTENDLARIEWISLYG